MKNYPIYFVLLLLFASCGQSIKGTITDNFNRPVAGVDIAIKNSDFKATSDSKGAFSIEYVAGSIELDFRKENYVTHSSLLEINDTKNYPLGEIKLFRKPDSQGVYVQTATGYDSIPQIRLKTESEIKKSYLMNTYYQRYFLSDNQSVFTIELDTLKPVTLCTYTNKILLPVKVNDGLVAVSKHDGVASRLQVSVDKVKTEPKIIINQLLNSYTFTPEPEQVYAFSNCKLENYTSSQISTIAYIVKFTLKNKTL